MRIIKSIVVTKKKIFCILGGIAALALSAHMISPTVQSVFHIAEAERKLPIYCVDTPEKKFLLVLMQRGEQMTQMNF